VDEAKAKEAATKGAAAPGRMLSALVVARNEERQLAHCLETLRFADEIVVLLDRTSDRSAEIARMFGARVVEGAWEFEGPRRNAGIAACTGEWILEVDADERVPAGLAREIRAAIAAAEDGYFLIPIANHVGQRLIRHGWGAYNGPAAKAALFCVGCKAWGEGRVHPAITLSGPRRRLAQPLNHFIDRDLSDMFERLNRDTDAAALDAAEKGHIPRLRSSFRRMFSRAWKSYVARRGYREGSYGIALALYSALYPMLIYLKAVTNLDGAVRSKGPRSSHHFERESTDRRGSEAE
jgi:glycosyltransferase involved in cell wall biosynthesis